MSSERQNYRLGDLATFKYGKFLPKADLRSEGFPVYSGYGVVGYLSDYQYEDPQLILVCRGEGGTGDVKISPPKCSITNLSIVFSVDESKVSKKFLFWALKSLDLRILRTGSAQAQIVIGSLENFSLEIPVNRNEQLGIAQFLDVLDDRITLLRETNATLEAIAQALFKSWFVDFDPVRAKQEGRSPEGMDEETAALFPDSFEESELGMIPRGWKVLSLDQIANYLNGLALQKFPPTGIDDLPVIKIAQLRKGDATGADLASRSLKPEYIIKDGDFLFSWSGTLMVSIWCGGEGALNQHLFKVSSDVFPKWFYYHWTLQHLSDFQMIAESKATTMGHIQRSHLSAAKVVVPNVEVITEAGALLEALLNRSVENQVQAKSLASIRDTLLPRLISGQLRLPEREAN